MKELLLVCIGSFFGGGMRYLVALLHERLTGPSAVAYGSFPWATFARFPLPNDATYSGEDAVWSYTHVEIQ